ncbi:MAG: DUF294 nucleotidyltransferase-like domain-containing protein [Thermodesulfobacteriota bacterium]
MDDRTTIPDLLKETPPFASLPEEDREEIAAKAVREEYPRGTVLAAQNRTPIDRILIVETGELELFFEEDGEKKQPVVLERGGIFGGISILMNRAVSVRHVQVQEDTSVIALSKEVFLEFCSRYEFFYRHFAEIFSERMHDASYAEIIASGQAFQFLSNIAPFSFLPEQTVECVAEKLSVVRYSKGTILFVQGESKVEYLYIIQKGAAERYFQEESQKKLLGMLSEGDTYGGISMLLNDGIAVRTLEITEDTFFNILPKDRFLELCDEFEAFSEFFTDTFGKRMLDRSYAAFIRKTMLPREDSGQFLNQSVDTLCRKDILDCTRETSIQEAARLMSEKESSSIFIRNSGGEIIGMVTDNDLRRKVIAPGVDPQTPVSKIMSTPLCAISAQALAFEAMLSMMHHNIKHLAVTDGEGVVGLITNNDLLTAQGQSPFFLTRQISFAKDISGIIGIRKQLPGVLRSLIQGGVKAENVNRLVTTVSDVILEKLIGFALEDMGEPPARFVFMIMGSEGRQEQTLKTDQDNAIVYENVPESSKKEVNDYFLKFGDKVCTWLDQVGYDFCEGGIMAKNPRWCQPISQWKDYFNGWIHAASPEDLRDSSIFFDFRGAYGDMNLVSELRKFLFDSLGGWAGFFRHLTENGLHFRPPIGFFRNFVVESKGRHRNQFDIKSAMTPIVDFARIYALKNQIEETNTLERLYQIHLKKGLSKEEYNDLEKAYGFLMQLRFVRQVTAVIEENREPDNYINPKKLSRIEQTMLKEIFKRIEKFQGKMEFEFTGSSLL